MAFLNEKKISLEELVNILESKGINLVLRKSKDGQLYGITYVDHTTRSVFNGSSLGKQYSAKGILERCEANNLNNENHHYQKSILIASENTKNLESKEYLKANPLDILLHAENSNEYVPKLLKQRKKRRIRKSI